MHCLLPVPCSLRVCTSACRSRWLCSLQVRQLVARSFSRLVPLLPLARGLPPPPFLDEETARKAREDAHFLEQLLDNRQADDCQLAVPLSVTLRR